jgi:hypothetical protein
VVFGWFLPYEDLTNLPVTALRVTLTFVAMIFLHRSRAPRPRRRRDRGYSLDVRRKYRLIYRRLWRSRRQWHTHLTPFLFGFGDAASPPPIFLDNGFQVG